MKKIYLAGPSFDLKTCEHWIARIKESPVLELTHDWCEVIRFADTLPDGPSQEFLDACAKRDWAAIDEADIFWMLEPNSPYASRGASTELGFALAGCPEMIVVSGPLIGANIFSRLATARYPLHADAFAFIEDWAAPAAFIEDWEPTKNVH